MWKLIIENHLRLEPISSCWSLRSAGSLDQWSCSTLAMSLDSRVHRDLREIDIYYGHFLFHAKKNLPSSGVEKDFFWGWFFSLQPLQVPAKNIIAPWIWIVAVEMRYCTGESIENWSFHCKVESTWFAGYVLKPCSLSKVSFNLFMTCLALAKDGFNPCWKFTTTRNSRGMSREQVNKEKVTIGWKPQTTLHSKTKSSAAKPSSHHLINHLRGAHQMFKHG